MSAKEREEKKVIIESGANGGEKTKYVDVRERVPRDFYISRQDAERLNQYTRGCPGCNSWFKGAKMPHNEECREIFRGLMKGEAKVRNAEARKAEFEEKMRRKAERKAKKKDEIGKEEEGKKSSETAKGSEGKFEEGLKEKEAKIVREDDGENLLESPEGKKFHRKYVREEEKKREKEEKKEKRRKIEEEKGPKLGWSKPRQPEWQKSKEGDETIFDPEGQMRADDFRKRLRLEAKGEEGELEPRAESDELEDEEEVNGNWGR